MNEYGKIFDRNDESSADFLIYGSVAFGDSKKTYYYLSDDGTVRERDYVMVPTGKGARNTPAKVVKAEYFGDVDAPLLLDETKKIVRKCTEEEIEKRKGKLGFFYFGSLPGKWPEGSFRAFSFFGKSPFLVPGSGRNYNNSRS